MFGDVNLCFLSLRCIRKLKYNWTAYTFRNTVPGRRVVE